MKKYALNRRRDDKRQKGFTMIELLIALTIMAIMAAGAVFYLNMSKSKGQTLYTMMQGVSSAATRFQLDTSCYPYQTNLLFDKSVVSGNTSNSCGTDISASWNGQYMQRRPFNSNGNITFPQIGPNVAIKIVSGTFLPTGGSTQYAVEAINVPTQVASQAFKACAGTASTTTSGSNTVAGQCFLGTASKGTNTFGFVFAG